MSKGNVFVISGPSGSGKDTLLRELFKKRPELVFSISSTTRDMREEDKKEKKYDFISKAQFEAMIAEDAFLEHNLYVSNYYGTPKAPVEKAVAEDKDMVIEVDVNGAAKIREKLPEAISIFIMPPSVEELERRLRARATDSEDIIAERLQTALCEIARANEYDYTVVNGEICTAVEDLNCIISACRLKN